MDPVTRSSRTDQGRPAVNGRSPGAPAARPAGDSAPRVVVVQHGTRPVGAFVEGDEVRWVDVRRGRAAPVLLVGLAVAGATAVGLRWAGHPQTIHRVTMGPGGWVSIKGGRRAEDPTRRPLWAKLLRAHRL